MKTLLLDRGDLRTDATGTIAVCDGAYASAQLVATAVKLQKGDSLSDTAQGVDWRGFLSGPVSLAAIRAQVALMAQRAAPNASTRLVDVRITKSRKLKARIEIRESGQTVTVPFTI